MPLPVFNDLGADACPDCRSIGAHTDKFNGKPVIAETRIFIQNIVILITGKRTTHLLEDVLIAVVVVVGKGNAVTFLYVSKAASIANVSEARPTPVAVHHTGHEIFKAWITGSEVKIEVAIVIKVTKI